MGLDLETAAASPAIGGNGNGVGNANLILPNSAPCYGTGCPNYTSMMTPNQLDFTSMTVTPGSSAPSRPLGPYPVSQEAAELTAELTGNWEADVF